MGSICVGEVHNVKPADGYVPNAETAIIIAEAVLIPIYGKDVLKKKPFHTKLDGNKWVVEGSLNPLRPGGLPIVEISKSTGEILRVSHGK